MLALALALLLVPTLDAPADPALKTCYAYVSSNGTRDHGRLTQYFSEVFSYRLPEYQDLCYEQQTAIENQYHDAFRAEFGAYPASLSGTTVFTFESRGAAERDRREGIADLRSDRRGDWTVRTFHRFRFYPED